MSRRGKDGIEEIIEQDKVTTYRMHPNQDLYFGEIMIAPNIPNSPLKMKDYAKRGIRLNPENLPFVIERNANIEKDGKGGIWAVPEGYKLEEYQAELKEPIRDGQYISRGFETRFRVVKNEPKTPEFVCDICDKVCASEFGLKSHKRSHKK